MSVMQNIHRSEIFLSDEMKKLEKLNFQKYLLYGVVSHVLNCGGQSQKKQKVPIQDPR